MFGKPYEDINFAQFHLQRQMTIYLRIIGKDIEAEIFANSNGLCHGLSICYSAMHALDQLAWWQSLLKICSLWNRTPDGLNKKIRFKNGKDPRKIFTVGECFEILYNHLIHQYILTPAVDRARSLDGATHRFDSVVAEIIDTRPVIFQAQMITTKQGPFSPRELIEVLLEISNYSKKYPSQKLICLMSSVNHTCCLNFRHNGKFWDWRFYDPNSQKLPQTSNIKGVAIETLTSLENTFSILLARIVSEGEIIEPIPQTGFFLDAIDYTKTSFYLLALDNPEAIRTLLTQAQTNSRVRKYVQKNLLAINKETQIHPFYIISFKHPRLLPLLFQLAEIEPSLYKTISKGLSFASCSRQNVLFLISFHDESLNALLELATVNDDIRISIIRMLLQPVENGWCALRAMARNAPLGLRQLFILAKEDKALRTIIAKGLPQCTTAEKETILIMIKFHAPEAYLELVELSRKHQNIAKSMDLAAKIKTTSGCCANDIP